MMKGIISTLGIKGMSTDLRLAWVYFAIIVMILLLFGVAWVMRRIINHAFASSGHDLYVKAAGKEPQCITCPFNKRCPYSDGTVCRFAMHQPQPQPLIRL